MDTCWVLTLHTPPKSSDLKFPYLYSIPVRIITFHNWAQKDHFLWRHWSPKGSQRASMAAAMSHLIFLLTRASPIGSLFLQELSSTGQLLTKSSFILTNSLMVAVGREWDCLTKRVKQLYPKDTQLALWSWYLVPSPWALDIHVVDNSQSPSWISKVKDTHCSL